MSLVYSNVLTAIGIGFTMIVGLGWVVPRLNVYTRIYYLFLLGWTVPYMLGQICQEDEWGAIWVQYHLADFSYIQASTAFGPALYLGVAKIKHWRVTHNGMIASMTALFLVSIVVSYGGEVWDTCWAWATHGSLNLAIDWIDYAVFTAGLLIVAGPRVLFPRFTAVTHAN